MRSAMAALTTAAIIFTASPIRADDEARAVVAAALKAHGGAEALAKHKGKPTIQKSKMTIASLNDTEASVETTSASKKFKQVIDMNVNGQAVKQVTVFDGKQMWIAHQGMVFKTLSSEEELAPIKERQFAEEVASLVDLDTKDVELALIGESKVGDAAVVGVRVSKKGFKDVSLYFDKTTHLLTKVESRGPDAKGEGEVGQEKILSDYKEIDGVKRPTRVAIRHDGKKVVDVEITETKFVDQLDDDTFEKPK